MSLALSLARPPMSSVYSTSLGLTELSATSHGHKLQNSPFFHIIAVKKATCTMMKTQFFLFNLTFSYGLSGQSRNENSPQTSSLTSFSRATTRHMRQRNCSLWSSACTTWTPSGLSSSASSCQCSLLPKTSPQGPRGCGRVQASSPASSRDAVGEGPGQHFFHIPTINMTNGTTDTFKILWKVATQTQCFSNNTGPSLDAGLPPLVQLPQWIRLSTDRIQHGTRGPASRHEATVNSCREPDEETSAAIRITDVRKTYSRGEDCPVIDTNVSPAKCVFRPVAKELAANVSAEVLKEMWCDEGEWQTMAAPCQRRKKSLASPCSAGLGMAWALSALALFVPSVI